MIESRTFVRVALHLHGNRSISVQVTCPFSIRPVYMLQVQRLPKCFIYYRAIENTRHYKSPKTCMSVRPPVSGCLCLVLSLYLCLYYCHTHTLSLSSLSLSVCTLTLSFSLELWSVGIWESNPGLIGERQEL